MRQQSVLTDQDRTRLRTGGQVQHNETRVRPSDAVRKREGGTVQHNETLVRR